MGVEEIKEFRVARKRHLRSDSAGPKRRGQHLKRDTLYKFKDSTFNNVNDEQVRFSKHPLMIKMRNVSVFAKGIAFINLGKHC
jgi:hypothetical protein